MRARNLIVFANLLSVAACCVSPLKPSGSDSGTGDFSGQLPLTCTVNATGTFTATIDGSSWTARCIEAQLSQQPGLPPVFSIAGGADAAQPLLVFGFATIGTPGTYPVGGQLDPSIATLSATINGRPAVWWANAVFGGNGTITVTSITATTAAGNFSITLVADPSTAATGTRTVNGSFNVQFPASGISP